MDSKTFIDSAQEFARQKNIDRPQMIRILEDVFRATIRKKYIIDDNFDVIINLDQGDLEIWRFREIVADEEEEFEETRQVRLADAHKIEEDFEVGEELAEAVKLEDFGRRAVQTARQTFIQKVKDLEKDRLYDKYKDLVGEIINGEIYQVLSREILLHDNEGNELILPRSEQIPKDRFRKGDTVRSIVHRVEIINGNPRIVLSRTSPVFLERLFEQEVPEIYDGLITIRRVVREPGERAKVAVESYDDRIDPVGACVGMKGSRIHSIVRELENENIDVINYTDNLELFIARSLSPAKITSLKVETEERHVAVFLKPDQVSLAIGRGGQNIKLASRLVDMEIDVFRDNEGYATEDDVPLEEFDDEIDAWMIQELKRIGLDTAKDVLSVSKEDLVRRTELEEEMVDEIFAILKQELEEDTI